MYIFLFSMYLIHPGWKMCKFLKVKRAEKNSYQVHVFPMFFTRLGQLFFLLHTVFSKFIFKFLQDTFN